MKSLDLLLVLVASLGLRGFAGATAARHEGLDAQIATVSERIRADPFDARLYLGRAQLHHLHGEPEAALADLDRAEGLDPALEGVAVARGRVLLDLGRPDRASAAIAPYLEGHPDATDALELRARIAAREGRHHDAERDWSRVIAAMRDPTPDPFLACARAARAQGLDHLPHALCILDEGLERLGDSPVLELFAIELELERGAYDAALARLEHIAARSARQERWLVQRADILVLAGRPEAARGAYRSALEAIDRLPPRLAATRAVLDLKHRAWLALEAPVPGSGGVSR